MVATAIGVHSSGRYRVEVRCENLAPPVNDFFAKDLLKVGGENVDPAEVEGFLLTHPGVAQVQIVGVPDVRLTEVACACVVAKPGHTIDNAALDAYCRGKLASFKIPRFTLCLAEFPMTASGKPQKFKLREMAAAKFGLA